MKANQRTFTYLSMLAVQALSFCVSAQSVLQFSSTSYYAVLEGTTEVEISVQRTNDLESVVSVDFATTNLSATAGLDYRDVAITLTFEAGETNRAVAVPILNDAVIEGIETFQAWLSALGRNFGDVF